MTSWNIMLIPQNPLYYVLILVCLHMCLESWGFSQELTVLKWNLTECTWLLCRMVLRKKRRVYNCRFPPQFLQLVSQSEVFLYPLLLPPQPFRCDGFAKPFYFPSEDLWVTLQIILKVSCINLYQVRVIAKLINRLFSVNILLQSWYSFHVMRNFFFVLIDA